MKNWAGDVANFVDEVAKRTPISGMFQQISVVFDEADEDCCVGDYEAVGLTLGGNIEATENCANSWRTVWDFFCDGDQVDLVRLLNSDSNVDEHVVARLTCRLEEVQAAVAKCIGHGSTSGLRIVPAVDVDAHSHFSDPAFGVHGRHSTGAIWASG